jgi:hypothetical protein
MMEHMAITHVEQLEHVGQALFGILDGGIEFNFHFVDFHHGEGILQSLETFFCVHPFFCHFSVSKPTRTLPKKLGLWNLWWMPGVLVYPQSILYFQQGSTQGAK